MKKLIACVLALVCVLGLAGCYNNSDTSPFNANENERTAFLRINQQDEFYDGHTAEAIELKVQFKSTEGPSELAVEVWYRVNETDEWIKSEQTILSLSEIAFFSIPATSEYVVMATATSGDNGNVIFQVTF